MAITTTPTTSIPVARGGGFFSRLGQRLVAARKARADQAVAAYLLSLDDATLEKLGHNRAQLEQSAPKGYPFL